MPKLNAYKRRAIPQRLAELLLPKNASMEHGEWVAKVLGKLGDSDLVRLWEISRTPGVPMLAQRDVPKITAGAERARKILVDGLKYHEHDGHDMPKRVARNALIALGLPEEEQP